MSIKPILKWAGGKTQILKQIIDLVPCEIKNYYEPFVGGGSVLLGILSSNIYIKGNIYVSDANMLLISLYQNVQLHVDELIRELKNLRDEYEGAEDKKQFYYTIRIRFNEKLELRDISCSTSAMFLFLNKTCFRGLYREGPKGFNVPYGHYKKVSFYDEELLRAVSKLIQRVTFSCCSFEETFHKLEEDDFIYLDPPYVPEKSTSFVSYTSKGFDETQHQLLFDECHKLKARGVNMLLSNLCCEQVVNTFTGNYVVKEIKCRRSINSKTPDETTKEVLITNYGLV